MYFVNRLCNRYLILFDQKYYLYLMIFCVIVCPSISVEMIILCSLTKMTMNIIKLIRKALYIYNEKVKRQLEGTLSILHPRFGYFLQIFSLSNACSLFPLRPFPFHGNILAFNVISVFWPYAYHKYQRPIQHQII